MSSLDFSQLNGIGDEFVATSNNVAAKVNEINEVSLSADEWNSIEKSILWLYNMQNGLKKKGIAADFIEIDKVRFGKDSKTADVQWLVKTNEFPVDLVPIKPTKDSNPGEVEKINAENAAKAKLLVYKEGLELFHKLFLFKQQSYRAQVPSKDIIIRFATVVNSTSLTGEVTQHYRLQWGPKLKIQ